MKRIFLLSMLLTLSGCAQENKQPETSPMPSFVDDYFNALFEWSPSFGTSVGLHQYDSKFEDLSAAAVEKRIQTLKEQDTRLAAIDRSRVSADEGMDADLIAGQIRAELL